MARVSYYPPRGGAMNPTLWNNVCLAAIAVGVWFAVLFGIDLL